ncbi:MAG: tyrosine-type recombinase/integrase [Thermoflexales bacterium]
MLLEFDTYTAWLHRRFPRSATTWHYPNDLKLIRAWFGRPLRALSAPDIDAYIAAVLERGHKANTITRRLAAVASFFSFLEITTPEAPVCPVVARRHRIKRPARLPRDVDNATIARLFAVVHNPRDRAMFALMFACGLRLGEVRNLTLDGLRLQPSPGALPRLTVIGKGNTERSVFIAGFALDPLCEWLRRRPAVDDLAVFLSRDNAAFSTTSIRRLLDRACARAGVMFTCHQLRHAFARVLTEQGVPVTTIQVLLGHRRIESTQVYLHVSDPVAMACYDAAMRQVAALIPLRGPAAAEVRP